MICRAGNVKFLIVRMRGMQHEEGGGGHATASEASRPNASRERLCEAFTARGGGGLALLQGLLGATPCLRKCCHLQAI